VVHGFGPNSAGEFLQGIVIERRDIYRRVADGAAIMKIVSATVKPVSFELGGKNAAIVFADCDFEEPRTGQRSRVLNTGQVCCVRSECTLSARFSIVRGRTERQRRGLHIGSRSKGNELGLSSVAASRESSFYYKLAREEGATLITEAVFRVWQRSR